MKTKMFDYTTVLATLQQIAPEAHIAGGAVRYRSRFSNRACAVSS